MKNTFGIPIIPDNDTERLLALARYDLLNTPPEESFTNLAHIISQVFHAPIALISLVDEKRVFFKANVGMSDVKSTSRGVSLCSLGILDAHPTVFEDALQEPCLLANPLVVGEFGLRFYAGAPLITPDGYNIGTVCVLDRKPRDFSEDDRKLLKRFAVTVMHEIELRLAARQKADVLETQVDARTAELRIANAELHRTNQELEQFAYVASHDLQEPLRKIMIFGGMLRAEYGSALEEKGQLYLQRIHDNTDRMRQLIGDLLEFSSIDKFEANRTTVDLNEVLNEIRENLNLKIEETAANIHTDTLPVVWAVSSQMHQLFFNLISNALKFSYPHTSPSIQVTSEPLAETERRNHFPESGKNYVKIMVADNGIGFEPVFAEKIFVIFQRLHNKNDYDGNGIGLAICKRIVENHGGVIFAENKPNEGASFKIILPMD